MRAQALDEHATMRAAASMGLDVARTEYTEFTSQDAIVITRFDRKLAADGRVVRLHQEDLCQALGVGEFAGRLYDYSREHPQFVRLLLWEALSYPDEVPDEALRRATYQRRSAFIEEGQASGRLTSALDPEVLHFILLALAAYWSVVPQVARMVTGTATGDLDGAARHRESVVAVARRLAEPA